MDIDNTHARDLVENFLLGSEFESHLSLEEEARLRLFTDFQRKYSLYRDHDTIVDDKIAVEFCKMKRMLIEEWLQSPFFVKLENYIPQGKDLKQHVEQDKDIINLLTFNYGGATSTSNSFAVDVDSRAEFFMRKVSDFSFIIS